MRTPHTTSLLLRLRDGVSAPLDERPGRDKSKVYFLSLVALAIAQFPSPIVRALRANLDCEVTPRLLFEARQPEPQAAVRDRPDCSRRSHAAISTSFGLSTHGSYPATSTMRSVCWPHAGQVNTRRSYRRYRRL